MANLEAKAKLTALQYALLLAGMQANMLAISLAPALKHAQGQAWMSVILAGLVYYFAAWMITKLALLYPNKTVVEYLPEIWGAGPAGIMIWTIVVVYLVHLGMSLQGFSREVVFFLFDRTPYEIIILTYVIAASYCAVQDLGTIIRVFQVLFFFGNTLLLLILLLSFSTFEAINLLPLWQGNWKGVAFSIADNWHIYSGYGVILVLMPQVAENKKLSRATTLAFGFSTVLYTTITVNIIGTQTARAAIKSAFPLVTAVRAVEIPGTFLERLDLYLLVAKMFLLYISVSAFIYVVAEVFRQLFGYRDRRPFVLLLLPVVFLLSDGMHTSWVFAAALHFSSWLGVAISFVLMPATLLLARRKSRGNSSQSA